MHDNLKIQGLKKQGGEVRCMRKDKESKKKGILIHKSGSNIISIQSIE